MNQADDLSYAELVKQLAEDGKQYARSKALLYRALLRYRALQMRAPLILFMIAVALTSAALVAILLGLVITLAEYFGGLGAGLIVGFVSLVLAALLVFIGWKLLPDLDQNPIAESDETLKSPALHDRKAEIEEELTENA